MNLQLVLCVLFSASTVISSPPGFRLGNEVLLASDIGELKSGRVALITNQTGILSDGTHILDALLRKGVNVVRIFTPEHGIRGDENYSEVDEKTGIPVVSLYGTKLKPSASDLSGIDVLVYDIQDVSARFYTYTSTLYYALEAAVESQKKIIVCDRPVIIYPDYVDGFMLENDFASFVGRVQVPVCYGMTCGELANYLNGELHGTSELLIISKMEGYSRESDYNTLNLMWIKPSPSMFTSSTAICYPATCFLEGTNASEGRGTEKPFEYFGAPWCDGTVLAMELNSYGFKGVDFEPVEFTPSEKISAYPPKFFKTKCSGVYINVTDKKTFQPVRTGVAILLSLMKFCPEFRFNKDNFIDKLAGTDKLRNMVSRLVDYSTIVASWEAGVKGFREKRKKYLLY